MSDGDDIHNYVFAGLPEMPWKRTEKPPHKHVWRFMRKIWSYEIGARCVGGDGCKAVLSWEAVELILNGGTMDKKEKETGCANEQLYALIGGVVMLILSFICVAIVLCIFGVSIW